MNGSFFITLIAYIIDLIFGEFKHIRHPVIYMGDLISYFETKQAKGHQSPNTKYERLKKYAKSKNISLNKLFDEFATVALAQYDAKTRFDLQASKGDKQRGLDLLDKLDSLQ
jgi:hypothetical protein